MKKLAGTISSQPIKYPFHHYDYPIFPPPDMRRERYRKTLLRLQILENMRVASLVNGCRVTGADIRRYTSDSFTDLFELWQVADYQIFGTEIPPEYYGVLLGDDSAPVIPLWHSKPARVVFRDPERIMRDMAGYNGVPGVAPE